DLRDANLRDANMIGAKLGVANLRDANLVCANLSGAELSCADLTFASLRGSYLSGASLIKANLSHANLSSANLSITNLIGADLSGANLSNANLSGANLIEANMGGANLQEANLYRANLAYVNLNGANLGNADLGDANLAGTDFTDANLAQTNLEGTIFGLATSSNTSNQGIKASYEWNGLYLRSNNQMKIAEALDRAGVLVYPNCRTRLNISQKPEITETDFLVFYQGKWGILEIDGESWHPNPSTVADSERDRLFKVHGIRVAHYDATRCQEQPDKVVQEFLEILSQSSSAHNQT
ncbi:MAG TPA: pentapeptide repeat-containing protein, partial [Oculatellaceae cyanobacterium]